MTTGARDSVAHWHETLAPALAASRGLLRRVIVLEETPSTQDAAREAVAVAGDVVTTLRQSAGRGRRGSAWADTGHDGLAVTVVLDRPPSERLVIACAIGVALAVETLLGRPAGIRWPNDVVADARKLAGILIEADSARPLALIGIGLNVTQTSWPEALADRAVSLRQLGADATRPGALCAVLEGVTEALAMDDTRLREEFAHRDVLTGTVARLHTANGIRTGRVVQIDPMRGLAIEAEGGVEWHAAGTTRVEGGEGTEGQRD